MAAYWLLWAAAVAVQPAFDVSQDLTSHLAARGARAPALGVAAVLAVAAAHAAAAVLLAAALPTGAVRRAAVAGLAVAAAATAGAALVRVGCPRGARGCGGPDSGRPDDLPLPDVLHAVLVVVFEVGFVAAALAVAAASWSRGRRTAAALSVLAAVVSPLLLLGVAVGDADGTWQLRWSVVGCAWLLLVTGAPRVASAPGGRSRS